MKKIEFKRDIKYSRHIFIWLFLLGLLISCGSNAVYGDEAVLVGDVYLKCSKNCRIHGSCGKSQETGKEVILLGAEPAFPGVSTIAFQGLNAETAVEILDTQVINGIEQNSNEKVQIRFYAVQNENQNAAGWVPGFCIANME